MRLRHHLFANESRASAPWDARLGDKAAFSFPSYSLIPIPVKENKNDLIKSKRGNKHEVKKMQTEKSHKGAFLHTFQHFC